MALGIRIVGAQDETPPQRPGAGAIRAVVEIVAEETGLEPHEIVAQVQAGTPLAEIITANGGDVDAVIDAAVSAATERINAALTGGTISEEQANRMLANLEEVVTRAVNGELFPNRPGNRGAGARLRAAHTLVDATVAETGLESRDILQQLRDGSTLADIITANGGSVENVVNSAVADATEQINVAVAESRLTREQADELIASLETVFTDVVNGELPAQAGRPLRHLIARGLARQVAEATGLELDQVIEQFRAGSTLADILTANGVDMDAFTQDVLSRASERLTRAVANGRITQEEADEMIAHLTERLPELLNTSRPTEGSA
jgi:urease gamma subunit